MRLSKNTVVTIRAPARGAPTADGLDTRTILPPYARPREVRPTLPAYVTGRCISAVIPSLSTAILSDDDRLAYHRYDSYALR